MKFFFEKIIIANDLNGISVAFEEGIPVIIRDLNLPTKDELLPNGKNKLRLLNYYIQMLSLAGLVPFAVDIDNIRIEPNKIFISGQRPWLAELDVKEIIDLRKTDIKNFKVIDRIRVKNCIENPLTELSFKTKFLNHVKFCSVIYNQYAEVTSYLNHKQIDNDEFSHIHSLIKIRQILKENNIKGAKKGFENRPHKGGFGKQRYRGIKLEFEKREILNIIPDDKEYTLKSKHEYLNTLVKHIWFNKRIKRNKQINKKRAIFTLPV